MGPEIPNSAANSNGGNGFVEMAASMPAFGSHAANQIGEQAVPEAPPTPTGEGAPTEVPAPTSEITSEEASTSTEEQNEASESGNQTEAKPPTTAETASEATTETADFPPELLNDINRYADQLERDAKKDQEMADLLHQFIDVASHQHSANHRVSAPSTPPAPSVVPKEPATQPETPAPTAPDASAAIAATLAETANAPIPGPATITTPAGDPSSTGEIPLAV